METIELYKYASSCGVLLLGEIAGKLCLCDWMHGKHHARKVEKCIRNHQVVGKRIPSETIALTVLQLDEYFAGIRTEFTVPMLLVGTDFQKMVWNGLMYIPYGVTKSYADLAVRLGCPLAVRAVANAVGANPISILLPCHRVIGADRSLTGYDGGLETKRFLLNLEGIR